MRSHNTYKPFGCKHCGKMFGLNEELIVHLRVHGERLMFKCNACDAEFAEHSYLKSHQRMHTQFEQKTRKHWIYKEDLDLDDRNNFLRDGEQPTVAKSKIHKEKSNEKRQPKKSKAKIAKPKNTVSALTDEDSISSWHDRNDDGPNTLDVRVRLPILSAEHIPPKVPLEKPTPPNTVTVVGPKTAAKSEIAENANSSARTIESVYIKTEQSDESDGEQLQLQRIDWKKFVEDRFSKQVNWSRFKS